jgi:hypothetical protein
MRPDDLSDDMKNIAQGIVPPPDQSDGEQDT